MSTLTLHRGIAVPSSEAKDVIAKVRSTGLLGNEGGWKFSVPIVRKVRDELERLFARPGLTADEIFGEAIAPGICACGSSLGAQYYAARHNSNENDDYPMVIAFEAPLDRTYVDPRDFLCTVFQMWDRNPETERAYVAVRLEELFGAAVLRYFDSAAAVSDQAYRIAMCNLASFDVGVVLAHYSNQKVIGGRYGTLFDSAFFVQGPVEANWIRDVYSVSRLVALTPDVTLHSLI